MGGKTDYGYGYHIIIHLEDEKEQVSTPTRPKYQLQHAVWTIKISLCLSPNIVIAQNVIVPWNIHEKATKLLRKNYKTIWIN